MFCKQNYNYLISVSGKCFVSYEYIFAFNLLYDTHIKACGYLFANQTRILHK